jgi:transcriptional regulator with XRE-family HTH domain
MNIGETIRNYRLQKGMSQGDIEKRTGLLRCYLSRVENGHTIPSLDTLAKIATAMELPLSQFFSDSSHTNGSKGLPQLSEDEVRFLSQIRRYSTSLNDSDRKLVLAMVKKMASSAARSSAVSYLLFPLFIHCFLIRPSDQLLPHPWLLIAMRLKTKGQRRLPV